MFFGSDTRRPSYSTQNSCDACHRLQAVDGKAHRSARVDGSRKRFLAETYLFTDVPLKRELSKSKESIRVLRSANNPSPSYRARPVARLSREGLRESIELCPCLFLSEVCSSQRGTLDVVISLIASLKSARGKDGDVAILNIWSSRRTYTQNAPFLFAIGETGKARW